MDETQATLIRLYPLGENGQIAVWMTPCGIQRTAARGALSPKSPFRGCIDLFFQCAIRWTPSKSGDLHALSSSTLLNPRLGLRLDYSRLSAASYFARLLLSTVEPGTPAEKEYHLLERALGYLERQNPEKRAILHFEKELALIQGIYSEETPPYVSLLKSSGKLPTLRQSLWDCLKD